MKRPFPLWMATIAVACALVGAACSASASEAAEPTATTSEAPTTTTTTEPFTVEEQVERAYLASWELLAEALADPTEPVDLETAFAGRALEFRRFDVERVGRANQAVRVEVVHDYLIDVIDDRTAVVVDSYMNHMVLIDPETKAPLEEDPNKLVTKA